MTKDVTDRVGDPPPNVVGHFERLGSSGDWAQSYDSDDGRTYHFHLRRQRVLDLLPARLGAVLDIGCGPGVMVDAVRDRGGTFLGIDLSMAMVDASRQRFAAHRDVAFAVGDGESLPLRAGTFDQVVCMGVLEYLRSPDRMLAEIARLLRPGGIAAISVPKRWHIDVFTVALTAPLRAVGRAVGLGRADRLPRLRLQPAELDAAVEAAGLVAAGGVQYYFTPVPYPFVRFAPGLSMRINRPFERWRGTRAVVPSLLAHGYVGRYVKPHPVRA